MFPAVAVRCIHDGGVSTASGRWPTPLAEVQERGPRIWGEFSFGRRYQSRGRVLRKTPPVKLLIIIFIVQSFMPSGGTPEGLEMSLHVVQFLGALDAHRPMV